MNIYRFRCFIGIRRLTQGQQCNKKCWTRRTVSAQQDNKQITKSTAELTLFFLFKPSASDNKLGTMEI